MFASNDKIVLSLVNIKNFNNVYLDCSYILPTEIPEDILKDIASIDVFEYHEGAINNGFIAFSIYVGEKTTLDDLITCNKKVLISDNTKIKDLNKPILYRIKYNKIIIMNELRDNDIVVHNKDELQKVIKIISIEYQNIKDSIKRVRTLNIDI